MPPQNLDAEESVLGAMMLSPGAIASVSEILTSDGREFYRESHAKIYRAALALWRGPAASNVDGRLLQAIAGRLNEDRIRAQEECIDLELSLGQHSRLVGELSELVEYHPLREHLRAQHMLALYRSARQAEALESFHEVRRILQDDLGIHPGDELTPLQHAILAPDPAQDTPREPHGSSSLTAPFWSSKIGIR